MKRTAFLLALGMGMAAWTPGAAHAQFDPQADNTDTWAWVEENDAHVLPFVRRHLVEPHGSLRVDSILAITRVSVGMADLTGMFIGAGAGFGFLGDGEAGILPLPLFFALDAPMGADTFDYGAIPLYGMYRFFGNEIVDLAGRLELVIPTGSDKDFAMTVGVPVRIRDKQGLLSIDTGVNLAIIFGNDYTMSGNDDTILGLATAYPSPLAARGGLGAIPGVPILAGTGIPIIVNFQPIDELFVGLRTGFFIGDFSNASDLQFIPLGFQGGYTLQTSSNFMIDFTAGFNWPFFVNFGEVVSNDTIVVDAFNVVLGAEIHIDLIDRTAAEETTPPPTPPPSDPAQPTPIY